MLKISQEFVQNEQHLRLSVRDLGWPFAPVSLVLFLNYGK